MTLHDDVDSSCAKPFLEHLEDLRKSLLWSAASLFVGTVVAIPLAPRILSWIKHPVARVGLDPDTFLRVLEVAGGFSIGLRLILWSGLLLGAPGIVVAIAGFVFPGLTPRERRCVVLASVSAAVMFIGGVAIGYLTTLPVAVRVMLSMNRWLGIHCDFVDLADYVDFSMKLLVAFGLACELPVIVLALGRLGILPSAQLRSKRRHVIVSLLVLSMFLTPPDPLTMLLMAVPLIALYEICIWVIRAGELRRKADPARCTP